MGIFDFLYKGENSSSTQKLEKSKDFCELCIKTTQLSNTFALDNLN